MHARFVLAVAALATLAACAPSDEPPPRRPQPPPEPPAPSPPLSRQAKGSYRAEGSYRVRLSPQTADALRSAARTAPREPFAVDLRGRLERVITEADREASRDWYGAKRRRRYRQAAWRARRHLAALEGR